MGILIVFHSIALHNELTENFTCLPKAMEAIYVNEAKIEILE
jgi:hypothetical protein